MEEVVRLEIATHEVEARGSAANTVSRSRVNRIRFT